MMLAKFGLKFRKPLFAGTAHFGLVSACSATTVLDPPVGHHLCCKQVSCKRNYRPWYLWTSGFRVFPFTRLRHIGIERQA
eukprot:913981-Amphidinium_carterae.1